MSNVQPHRPWTFGHKIAYRAYLATMRMESMAWVALRCRLVDRMLGRRHHGLNIFPDVFLEDVGGLTIGDHVSINRGSNLSAVGGLTIGNYVAIGHGTSILTTEHGFDQRGIPIKYQPIRLAPVLIGDDVWIGAKVSILAGVTIARGTVVAAGAVVTRSITESDTIVGGIPARRIRGRFDRLPNNTLI